jgi:hypothetical protein
MDAARIKQYLPQIKVVWSLMGKKAAIKISDKLSPLLLFVLKN